MSNSGLLIKIGFLIIRVIASSFDKVFMSISLSLICGAKGLNISITSKPLKNSLSVSFDHEVSRRLFTLKEIL